MKKLIYLFVMAILVSGCAHPNISKIDVTKVESNCARECTQSYSQCVSGGPKIGYSSAHFGACKEGYQACIQTCPSK